MALQDLSFRLYLDAGLLQPYTGLTQLSHLTDLSDNPQRFVVFFGSTTAGRTLQTAVNPGVDQITLTPGEILEQWAADFTYSIGESIEPTVNNGLRYTATTAGLSGSVEPVWNTGAIGSTTLDNEIIWRIESAKHEPTEIKLASTLAGLDSAVGGAALLLGTTLSSGAANAAEINVEINNAVSTVGSNTGQAELAVLINDVIES